MSLRPPRHGVGLLDAFPSAKQVSEQVELAQPCLVTRTLGEGRSQDRGQLPPERVEPHHGDKMSHPGVVPAVLPDDRRRSHGHAVDDVVRAADKVAEPAQQGPQIRRAKSNLSSWMASRDTWIRLEAACCPARSSSGPVSRASIRAATSEAWKR